MTEYYTRIQYPYNGDTDIFSIPFSYRDQSYIKVEITDSIGIITAYAIDTDFEFINQNQIRLKTLPDIGSTIEIYRDSKKDKREEDFSNGEVYIHELNNSFNQDFDISQEAFDLATKSITESRNTIATANDAYDLSVAARDDAAEALGIADTANNTAAQANTTAEAADTKADQAVAEVTAAVARVTAAETAVAQKANIDGSNLVVADVLRVLGFRDEDLNLDLSDLATKGETAELRLQLAPLDVGTSGTYVLKVNGVDLARADLSNVDISGFVGTNATNADAESFRSLVGMPEVESNITGLQTEVASTGSNVAAIASRVTVLENDDVQALCYAPQTIIAGATGDLPDGWTLEDCDAPAAHIYSSGTNELTIVAGLQVAAGYEGQVYVSEALTEDATLDISDLISGTEGTAWIYADVGTDGSLAFGFTEDEPVIGLQYAKNYDSILSVFSSNTLSGVGTVSASSLYSTTYDVYKAFTQTVDSYSDCWLSANSATTGWLRFVGVSTLDDYVAVGYRIAVYTPGDAPLNWAFLIGSGETPDTTVDSQASIIGWTQGVLKTFIFDTPVDGADIQSFELNITASQSGAGNMQIGRLELLYAHKSDFYNTAKQAHYDSEGNAIRRVYLGSVDVVDGAIEDITNYQHGTEYTEIINDNEDVTINSIYYPKKRYLGSCYPTARVFVEKHWGRTGFFSYSGFSVGVRVWSTGESLSVHTALAYLTHVQNTALATFTTYVTSAPCKITVKRGY